MFQKKKVVNELSSQDDHDRYKKLWEQFVQMTHKVVDPIVYSMLHGSVFEAFDKQKNIVRIRILKKFMIFHDLFSEYKSSYQSLLERCFQAKVILCIDFYQEEEQKRPSLEAIKPIVSEQIKKVISGKLDISDKEKWELTHTLLKLFGGTVSELGKDTHEPNA